VMVVMAVMRPESHFASQCTNPGRALSTRKKAVSIQQSALSRRRVLTVLILGREVS
jgi:hypothetical protein